MDAVIENAPGLAKGRRSMMAQVNARIETEIKRAADAAFAHAGIAPSEAIRALYARAAALWDHSAAVIIRDELRINVLTAEGRGSIHVSNESQGRCRFTARSGRYGTVDIAIF